MNWFLERAEAIRPNRRQVFQVGVSGILGMSLPQCLAAAAAESGKRQAKNVLVVLEQGGLSHIDTWDPKPDMVADHRSPYKPVSTRVPGMQFTELLTQTAKVADKLAVVRSMHHTKNGADEHPRGTQYALSGSHPTGASLEMPDIGCIATRILGSECQYLPPYIMVPGNHEQAAMTRYGFLPASTKVFKTQGRDVSDPKWTIDGIVARSENQGGRMDTRRTLRSQLQAGNAEGDVHGMNRFYDQAFDLLTSPKVSEAFDLGREPQGVRERYGLGHRGACYLMGRKLVEAGVRFVTVDVRWPSSVQETPKSNNLNWDHHDHIYASGTCDLPGAAGGGAGRYGIGHWVMMGSTDQAFSALIEDLDQRGLLAETLVCFITEFGRTPKINKSKGRDHWIHAYSIAFAGAGVPGGQVIGKTERDGGHVMDQPHTPEDYAATIYEKLGINRGEPLYTSNRRPVYFGHEGEPIPQLFS